MALSAAARAQEPVQDHFKGEDFASLLDETLGVDTGFDGSVVTGRGIRLTDEFAVVDVGLKSEGRVALKEFGPPGAKPDVKPGDMIELYVERYEDRDGAIILSREKARREEAWTNLEKAFEAQKRGDGTIYGRVKGGFTVDLRGAVAFPPRQSGRSPPGGGRRPFEGQAAAIPDPQEGPRSRQHRRVPPCRSRGNPS